MDLVRDPLIDRQSPAATGGDLFAATLQQITSGALTLGALIPAAIALTEAGQVEAARQLYKVWIAFNPDAPLLHAALFNASALDSQLGDVAAATKALEQAISLRPDFTAAHINLGILLERAGDPSKAIEQWQAAVAKPTVISAETVGYAVSALKQTARVLSEHHQLAAAETALGLCLDIDPRQKELFEQYFAMRLAQCKWPVVEPRAGLDRRTLLAGMHPLTLAAYTDDPLMQLGAAERFARLGFDAGADETGADRRDAPTDVSGRRIRVGYVSSDLRDHAIGYLMAELFETHDPATLEVFVYYCGPPSTNELHVRAKAAVEHWTDIRELDDEAAARRIADDGIDVLVDVNGHTRDARTGVFARRPAPIQVNWLGYPGTMGTPYHQYIIADDWIIPPESELYYSEKVVRLPCYQPNDRKRARSPERPTRAEAGLPEDAFVYCCFNGAQKITRSTFDRWLQILQRRPGSVLWLLEGAPEARARLLDYAEANGVARERFVFAPKTDNPRHLARHALADLFLDTGPYGAHTTASDALFMSVPILTLSGRSFASRVCGSLTRAAGLPELVCLSPQDYVERAVALGADRAQVEAYKARLRACRHDCVLFDTDKLTRVLEGLYRDLCAERQAGRLPRPDLTNLETYLQVGLDHDHEAQEVAGLEDYHGLYRARLAKRHRLRPIGADRRLWTAADIAAVESVGTRQGPRTQAETLIERYNVSLASGDIEQAETSAAALVALAPGNEAMLAAAFSCNQALGRADKAAAYAEALLAVDPEHAAALTALAERCLATGDGEGEIRHRIALAMSARNELHPLVRLRDLHDVVSMILCRPPSAPGAAQIRRLLAAAQAVSVDAPEGSEWASWEKHYRLMLQAVDLDAIFGPTPKGGGADPRARFRTSTGEWLDPEGLRATAERLGARTVFFAAADRTYVDLYARWYALSILSQADVSCLVVIHVIGGKAELEAIADSVGVRDERLIFTADDFDAGQVTTRCYDAPPKGLIEKPVAHYQSIRFLRLGALLDQLGLPVFVSDIDLLLQRGVADLLDRCADADVVLNENGISRHAGSRLTANLVLVRPTANAARFLAFLETFLTGALAAAEVTRWIDQLGLLLARAHLQLHGEQPQIAYFDTSSDINNVMYPSYQENPFRFLSLYHGFDLSSLEGHAKTLDGSGRAAKRAGRRGSRAA